jgi:hypothetical protein
MAGINYPIGAGVVWKNKADKNDISRKKGGQKTCKRNFSGKDDAKNAYTELLSQDKLPTVICIYFCVSKPKASHSSSFTGSKFSVWLTQRKASSCFVARSSALYAS